MQTSFVIKLVLTWLIDSVTSAWVIKLVIAFSGNLYVLINIYFSFCLLGKPTQWCHRLPSNTRLMIVYSAFLPPFPLHSHALHTSVTHSSHLYSNFLSLYLLVRPTLGPLLDYIFFSWSMLASGILPSLSIFRSALSISVLRAAMCLGC